MDLVIDANILFSVLIKEGKNEDLIFNNDIHLFAPEFIFEEFNKYETLLLDKTQRTEEEFSHLLDILKKKIQTIANEETAKYFQKALEISPDKKDADYFALAMKLNCPIWSNDKDLKNQDRIEIYSTEDLLKMFIPD